MDLSQAVPLLALGVAAVGAVTLTVVYWPRPRSRAIHMPISGALNRELSATRCYKAAFLPHAFAQVSGTAAPTQALRTPIWGAECVAYRAELLAMRTVPHRRSSSLTTGNLTTMIVVHVETGAVPFDVVDDTGRVRVEADSRMRLAVSLARTSSRGWLSRLTPEAHAYLERTMDTLEGSVEVRECWVPVGARCFVAGQATPATSTTSAKLTHGERELILGD